jgi:hypothetical protein
MFPLVPDRRFLQPSRLSAPALRGRRISAFAFSAALAACRRPPIDRADAAGSGGRPDAVAIDVGADGTPACPDGRHLCHARARDDTRRVFPRTFGHFQV